MFLNYFYDPFFNMPSLRNINSNISIESKEDDKGFEYKLVIPAGVDINKISATKKDGTLIIVMPKETIVEKDNDKVEIR